MQKNITQIIIKRLLPLLLILMLFSITVIALSFRSLVLMGMEEHIHSIAQITKASLTAHMKAGTMDKRAYFLNELTTVPHVKSAVIIRSDELNKEFGNSPYGEKGTDHNLRKIFQSKKPYFTITEWSEQATMHAVVPYIATSQGNLNCLQCHHVPENTVLGAIDIELDIREYRNWAFVYLLIFFGIVSLIIFAIIFTTSHVVKEFVHEPLLELIQFAQAVFFRVDIKIKPVFKSIEFTEMVSHLQKFGEELKERELKINQKATELKNLTNEIDETLKETIFAMGEAEEKRSSETHNHTRRVVEYSRLLGKLAGLSEPEVELLTTSAPLHDIGKIGIPDSVLLKPGTLTVEERTIIEKHTVIGYDILKHSENKALLSAAIIAHEHHERWDGLGYPIGKKGEEIHIFGRIVSIADVFDALSTKRIYKTTWSLNDVQKYFQQERGKAFDPHLIDLLAQHYHQFEALYSLHYNNK